MNQLAIFDVDGTLTDTTSVDDECYRDAMAEVLGVPAEEVDWSGAAHVTDAGIIQWLWSAHRDGLPTSDDLARARSVFLRRLAAAVETDPSRFKSINGAGLAMRSLAAAGWRVAVATGGWGPSARLKLQAARIHVDYAVLACADDAMARPDIVRIAQNRAESFFQCTFGRVVTVGDGPWDVAAASELDLPFIGIGSGARDTLLRRAGAATVLPDYTNLSAFRDALASAKVPMATMD